MTLATVHRAAASAKRRAPQGRRGREPRPRGSYSKRSINCIAKTERRRKPERV
jgi:hypothetical protein